MNWHLVTRNEYNSKITNIEHVQKDQTAQKNKNKILLNHKHIIIFKFSKIKTYPLEYT